jgi:uncharacterized protein
MSGQARFRFASELHHFLPPAQRKQLLTIPVQGSEAVKHLIEALGAPHPEIGCILVNGQPVDFAYRVQAGDQVEIYAVAGEPCTDGDGLLRPPLIPPIRFVVDTHLGQLATYLRLLGFDTLYRNDYDDVELAEISSGEGRILLTRDRGLLKRKIVVYGYSVRTGQPRQQLLDVLRRYGLTDAIQPWCRCLRCNGLLIPTPKSDIIDQLEPNTRLYYDNFQRCTSCGQIYWQGSHYTRVQQFVAEILQEVRGDKMTR